MLEIVAFYDSQPLVTHIRQCHRFDLRKLATLAALLSAVRRPPAKYHYFPKHKIAFSCAIARVGKGKEGESERVVGQYTTYSGGQPTTNTQALPGGH